MTTFKSVLCIAALGLLCGRLGAVEESAAIKRPDEKKPVAQIAILLDNSGSMSGLIAQAKSQLWKIVNEFATAKKAGKRPELQVALYTYGDPPPRQLSALTTDLDKISDELFKVAINGGSEFCGLAIKTAADNLAWSSNSGDYKAIFIAGNEPFTQGNVHYAEACRIAIEKGIIVNTIHCGSESEGVSGKWQDGAALADGRFLNIDQNQQVAHIAAPQDAEIARLGVELNKTYVAFGALGAASAERQAKQDGNADAAQQGALVQRALCKASVAYDNRGWDLVDACKNAPKKLEELKDAELPEELRKMTLDERKAFVEKKTKERDEVQTKINTLNEERRKFVAEASKTQSSGDNTLDAAVIKTVREQGAKKAYEFAK